MGGRCKNFQGETKGCFEFSNAEQTKISINLI
jgi:hypothetical protein